MKDCTAKLRFRYRGDALTVKRQDVPPRLPASAALSENHSKAALFYDFDAVATFFLGPIEGLIGPLQQIVG